MDRLIHLPRTEGDGPWKMPIYVLSRNDLCLFTVTLDVAGGTAIVKTVLEAHTPLLPATSCRRQGISVVIWPGATMDMTPA